MTHSNILDIVSNKDMGLKLFKSALLPFLYIGFTLELLKVLGNIPVFRD